MITFAELVETVEHLSEDERDELGAILRKKKEEEILKASKDALKEYEKGKTIALSPLKKLKSISIILVKLIFLSKKDFLA